MTGGHGLALSGLLNAPMKRREVEEHFDLLGIDAVGFLSVGRAVESSGVLTTLG